MARTSILHLMVLYYKRRLSTFTPQQQCTRPSPPKPGTPGLVQWIRPELLRRHAEAVALAPRHARGRGHQHRPHAADAAAVVAPGAQQAVGGAAHVVQGHLLQELQGAHDGQGTYRFEEK